MAMVRDSVAVVWWVGRSYFGVWPFDGSQHSGGNARQILEEGLARGEIDAEAFERQRSLLGR